MSGQSIDNDSKESSSSNESELIITKFRLLKFEYKLKLEDDAKILKEIEIEVNDKIISFQDVDGKKLEFDFSKFIIQNSNKCFIMVECDDDKMLNIFFKSLEDYNSFLYNIENQSKINQQVKRKSSFIENAFKCELKKPAYSNLSSKDYLKLIINNYLKENENVDSYHGPYSVICQSSGFGKSRACLSLKDDFYIVYICLRDSKSKSGYPPTSECAHHFIHKYSKEKTFKKFFIKYLNFFIDELNDSLAELNYKKFKDEFSQDIIDSIQKLASNARSQKSDDTLKFYNNRDKPLIFVFDEASKLFNVNPKDSETSNYFIMRKVLSNLKGNLFVLFLDTFSVLSDYMPAAYADPSRRIKDNFENSALRFHPIYLLPTWDAYADYDAIKNIKDSIKIENICKFGRVLWGNLYETYIKDTTAYRNEDINENFLYKLAVNKLIGGVGTILESDDYTRYDYLAILSTRLGAFKINLVTANQMLVAKNMAVCTYVDIINNIFEIDYPSEPILAEAGAVHLASIYEESIQQLQQCISSSIVDQGETGETIAKLILIRAMDEACKVSYQSNPNPYLFRLNYIQVGTFLTFLYGKCPDNTNCGKINDEDWVCNNKLISNQHCAIRIILDQYVGNNKEMAQRLLNAYLNFNHFSKINDCLLRELDLRKVIKRCAAIHCNQEESGIGLTIPITFSQNNFDELSAIFVQVKLHKEAETISYNDRFDKLLFKSLNIGEEKLQPYLLLFMELGWTKNFKVEYLSPSTNENTKNFKTGEENYRFSIVNKGISSKIFPSLSETAVKNLINLANTVPKMYFNGFDPKINSRLQEINKINQQIRPEIRCAFNR